LSERIAYPLGLPGGSKSDSQGLQELTPRFSIGASGMDAVGVR